MNPPAALPLMDAPTARPQLTKRRKAAVVVQMLLADGQRLSLSRLPEEVQLDLTRELGKLKLVDRTTLHAIASEFVDDLERVGLAAPGDFLGALEALSDQISPGAASRLRKEAQLMGADPWSQVMALPIEELVPILEEESVEVAAVILSKLPVAKAAELLGKLPGERARRITFAVSQTSEIQPLAVARIGAALARTYCSAPPAAFANPPVQRVGAILNSSIAATRDSVLEGLGNDDPEFAEKVRKAIFTYENIPERIEGGDIPAILREVDNAILLTALVYGASLGGPNAQSTDFILGNLSKRMADGLREEMAVHKKVRKSDGEDALNDVIGVIRAAVDAGEIAFKVPDEDDD